MTLEQIGHLIGQFVSMDRYAGEFSDLLNFAQYQYFAANISNDEVVYPFIRHKGVDNGTMPLVVSSAGLATIPSDFAAHRDMTFIYAGVQRQVEVLKEKEFNDRKSSSIEIPNRSHPIACYYHSYIKFLPRNVQAVSYTYLSKPARIVYAVSMENGRLTYDPTTSTELAWDEQSQVEIVRILLQELGVIVTNEEVKSKIGKQ
jgi:hypothetical protein